MLLDLFSDRVLFLSLVCVLVQLLFIRDQFWFSILVIENWIGKKSIVFKIADLRFGGTGWDKFLLSIYW